MNNVFFGIHVDPNSLGGMSLVLLLSIVLAGMIGLERELHGHPAGLRTHILVCMGSTLITMVSVHIGTTSPGRPSDPARLAAQIVSGIGFLGAGAIIREGATVKGLTTAASIWTTAGIGIALGAGPYYGQIALIATVLVLGTLWLLNVVEDWIEVKLHRRRVLEVEVTKSERFASIVLGCLAAYNVNVFSIDYRDSTDKDKIDMRLLVRIPERFDRETFLADLAEHPGVTAARM